MSGIKSDVKETVKAFIQTFISIVVKEITKKMIKGLNYLQKKNLEAKIKNMSEEQLAQFLLENPCFIRALENALNSLEYAKSAEESVSLMEKLQSIFETTSAKELVGALVWPAPRMTLAIIVAIILLATVAIPTLPGIFGNNNSTNNNVSENITHIPIFPVANFSSNVTRGTAPLTVQFSDLSKNANEWNWNFGDGNNSIEQNPVHTYSTAGNYTVDLTAINGNNTNSTTATIIVEQPKPKPRRPDTQPTGPQTLPVANFSTNVTSGFTPLTVQFIDLSENATSWSWGFGDGNNTVDQNPVHTYTTESNYIVSLTASNENGTNSKSAQINVYNISKPLPVLPEANFNSNVTSGIAPLSVQFIDSSKNATSWSWDFGDGQASSAQNPITTYYSVGTYTVSLNVSNANGSSISTKSNLITVGKTTPAITWNNPADITYGTALSETQLHAVFKGIDGNSLPGNPTYTPAALTVLSAGTHTLHVDFTPTDNANYTNATADVQINVLQATPTIDWNNPADITYGEELREFGEGAQLNAVFKGIDGNPLFGKHTYSPTPGTVLSAGSGQNLHVDFTPSDSNYTNSTANVQINVLQAIPIIDWSNPADIIYGTALGSTQLNAVAKNPINGSDLSAAGKFTYNPENGTVLSAGAHTLQAIFAPKDDKNYTNSTASVQINVLQATPIIDWRNPADIIYGTALSSTQLNAVAKNPVNGNDLSATGTFTYKPTKGSVLTAGDQQTLSVVFTTADHNYTSGPVSKDVQINVLQATPTIDWSNPADITYGESIEEWILNEDEEKVPGELNAIFSGIDGKSLPGSHTYEPAAGTVLSAGTHTLHVDFTPIDTANYTNASKDVQINVLQATPTIDWSNPDNITYGEELRESEELALISARFTRVAQLDAVFRGIDRNRLLGNHTYTPKAGTVLSAGTHTLHVDFTPSDTVNYTNATKDVQISVLPEISYIRWNNPDNITYGTALGSTQLNASTTNLTTGASIPGNFAYTFDGGVTPFAYILDDGTLKADKVVLGAGTHTLTATFTPTDKNYSEQTESVELGVSPAIPDITWNKNEEGIYDYKPLLSQINATAKYKGSEIFGTYNYRAYATYMEVSSKPINNTTNLTGDYNYSLTATFEPFDTNYTNATGRVKFYVIKTIFYY